MTQHQVIRISPSIHRRAKSAAALTGLTLQQYVEAALRAKLKADRPSLTLIDEKALCETVADL